MLDRAGRGIARVVPALERGHEHRVGEAWPVRRASHANHPTTPGTIPRMSALQAVLFDMDGTIVDTEPYWIAAEYALVESFGGTWTDALALSLVGNALPKSAAILRGHGVDMTPEDIIERLTTEVIAACETALPWRPGARELLAALGE